MRKRKSYYTEYIEAGQASDYSRPEPTAEPLASRLIEDARRYIALKEATLPAIDASYPTEQIERENKEWWPTHCEALRRHKGNLLVAEYRDELVYFCQDGPFHGLEQQKEREKHWWALMAQPGVIVCWPVVMFHGEFVWFEWNCIDVETGETIAKGNVCWIRRGHRGGCYFKGEQLTFYRDVHAPDELLRRIEK
jgi:hypothetical protein